MKYAIMYEKNFRYFTQIDEVIFKYGKSANNIEDVFNALKELTKQRIIFNVTKEEITKEDMDFFRAVRERHPATALLIRIDHPMRPSIVAECILDDIQFFFYDFADTWDKLTSMVRAGVSDVYIVSDLAFDIINVKEYCKKYNVNVRTFPNVAQISSKINNLSSISSFFIRPEDIPIYEPFIDVCEFFGELDRQSVLYEIYTSNKWLGSLKDLILNFESAVDNSALPPDFVNCRLFCRKKCNQDKCNLCQSMEAVSKTLSKNNLIFSRKKD